MLPANLPQSSSSKLLCWVVQHPICSARSAALLTFIHISHAGSVSKHHVLWRQRMQA